MLGKQKVMSLIYEKINEVLGAGDQLFSMQFPAQSLNYKRFQYDTSDRNSVLTRPYTIAEAEFRLSDQLFNVSPITQGPNGEKLSTVYRSLVDNYVPRLENLAPFFRDRAGLGRFLLEDSGETDVQGNALSRMELSKELYQKYLEAKNEWDEEKNDKFIDFKKRDDIDGYATWMSSFGQGKQELLNNLYNDVVVRGHLHEVMTILGYLNVSSTAEELEAAKQHMRHSARSSLDESMTVYPVQFQPSNWFRALEPNLQPKDLTMAKDVICYQLREKRKELSRAKAELREISLLDVDPKQIEKLAEQVRTGKEALAKAEASLIDTYGQSIVMAVKSFFSYTSKGGIIKQLTAQTGGVINPSVLKDLGLIDDDTPEEAQIAGEVIKSMSATYEKNQAVLNQAEELSQLRARKVQLESQDMKIQKLRFQQRVEELTEEVEELSQLIVGVHYEQLNQAQQELAPKKLRSELEAKRLEEVKAEAEAQNISMNDIEKPLKKDYINRIVAEKEKELKGKGEIQPITLLPKNLEEAELDGMFTDVVINVSTSEDSLTNNSESESNQSSWRASGWFASGGGQSHSASSTSEQEAHFMSKSFDIGFRVAKVTFDRGGWFNPHLFKMSHAFYRLADLKAGAGLTIKDIQGSDSDGLKKKLVYAGQATEEDTSDDKYYMLPAYPVAMVIAKDITIKVSMTEDDSKASKTMMEKSSSSGGGFFGFSCSNSSASGKKNETAFHGHQDGHFYIRIPGPQVIGHFLQLTPLDNTELYDNKDIEKENHTAAMIEALDLFTMAKELTAEKPSQLESLKLDISTTNGNNTHLTSPTTSQMN